jgi:phage shock protein C
MKLALTNGLFSKSIKKQFKMKRLRKSQDRKIAGVCGGISEYINPELDPILVRIGFVVLGIFNPLMVVVYLILAIAMSEPEVVR